MFCRNCGAQLEDNQAFCGSCGWKTADGAGAGESQGEREGMQSQGGQPEEKESGTSAAMGIFIICLIVVGIFVAINLLRSLIHWVLYSLA